MGLDGEEVGNHPPPQMTRESLLYLLTRRPTL